MEDGIPHIGMMPELSWLILSFRTGRSPALNGGAVKMTVSQIVEKMIRLSEGNIHDIEHFLKVWSYAKTIGELEGLDPGTQFILESAAVTHDIACPVCRIKYGNASGKLQEKESPPLITAFFADTDMDERQTDRVSFLVGHHHTYEGIDGPDWQILLEADYIVNASENNYSADHIKNFLEAYAKTSSGKRLIRQIFGIQDECCTGSPDS